MIWATQTEYVFRTNGTQAGYQRNKLRRVLPSPDSIASFDARYDNLRIRPYAFPEPSASLGTEHRQSPVVTFDGQPCQNVVVSSPELAQCITPPHPAGTVDVIIANPDAHSHTLYGSYTFWEALFVYLSLILMP